LFLFLRAIKKFETMIKTIYVKETQQMSVSCNVPLAATIASSSDEILKLAPFVNSLEADPGMIAPRFFLASIVPQHWSPRVVVVSQGPRIAGLLFCKERILAGIATGIAFGDDTLGRMIAAAPEETEPVFRCAVEALLKGMVALRFRVGSDRLALMEGVKLQKDICSCAVEHHAYLELPQTFDEFLGKIGPATRRNLRRYRRRSEAQGIAFSADQDFSEFCSAARGLFPNTSYRKSKRELERALGMISAMPSPSRIMVGLRRASGEWLGLAGGWHEGHRAILKMQLNDVRFARESISVVLRCYLIEMLIQRGFREIVFWGGTSEPFSNYTTRRKEFMTYLDVRSHRWRLFRKGCATLIERAPRTLGKWLRWVAPVPSRASLR
jgi:Acetyltransferase (GNAT) domain